MTLINSCVCVPSFYIIEIENPCNRTRMETAQSYVFLTHFVSHVGILSLNYENFDILVLRLRNWFLQYKHQGQDTSGIFGHVFSQVWILNFTQMSWCLLTSFLPVEMTGSWYHISVILSSLKKHRGSAISPHSREAQAQLCHYWPT